MKTPLDLPCSKCGAKPGEPCTGVIRFHHARFRRFYMAALQPKDQ